MHQFPRICFPSIDCVGGQGSLRLRSENIPNNDADDYDGYQCTENSNLVSAVSSSTFSLHSSHPPKSKPIQFKSGKGFFLIFSRPTKSIVVAIESFSRLVGPSVIISSSSTPAWDVPGFVPRHGTPTLMLSGFPVRVASMWSFKKSILKNYSLKMIS